MTTEKLYFGICKQVNQGDSIVVREKAVNGPPPTKIIGISNISCPRLQFRPQNEKVIQDERFAWEAREYLRMKIVGELVCYTETRMPKGGIFGDVYIGKTPSIENNVAYLMVSEGFAEVRKINNADVAAKNKVYQQLIEAENFAKSQLKGRWNTDSNVVGRTVCWSIPDTANFLKTFSGKDLQGVVEYVRDGSSMQICLMPKPGDADQTFYPVMVSLAGIKTPGYKNDKGKMVPEKFAEQAKLYVETRLLQRNVVVRLVSTTGGQNFLATVIHPRGDICEFLLQDGLAHCLEWGLDNLPASTATSYRQKEQIAKKENKNLWQDYKPPAPPSEAQLKLNKQKTAQTGKEFSGTIIEVGLGDNVTIKCDNGATKKIYLASLRPVRPTMEATEGGEAPVKVKVNKPLYDIPYMYEAREFLRKHIGKRANVHIDYTLPKPEGASANFEERVCATVETQDGLNLAQGLISKGLAQVVRYKRQSTDPRAKNYELLLAAEEDATAKAVGWHSKGPAPIHRIKEVTGSASKAILPSLQRGGKLHGIVEFVATAGRLKVLIPQHNCSINLLLSSIDYPKTERVLPDGKVEPADPMGEEATQFTKEHCMQRNIEIEVEALDRVGNFIGYAHLHQNFAAIGSLKPGDNQIKTLQSSGKVVSKLLNAALVLQGLATVNTSFKSTKSPYYSTLSKAQIEAQAAKNGLWGNPAFMKKWLDDQNNNEPQPSSPVDEESFPATNENKTKDQDESKGKNALKNRIKSAKAAHLLQVNLNEPTTDVGFRVFLQANEDSGKMTEIQRELNAQPPSSAECASFKAERGTLCAAKFHLDNQWYRALITSVGSNSITVLFIDYGNSEEFDLKQIKQNMGPLPKKLSTVPYITKQYRIAGICMPPDMDDRYLVAEFLAELVGESAEVLMAVESPTPVPCNKEDKKPVPLVTLFLPKSKIAAQSSSDTGANEPEDVAELLLKRGLVYVERARMPQDQKLRYEEAQTAAKKSRMNIWRHGDCRPDD